MRALAATRSRGIGARVSPAVRRLATTTTRRLPLWMGLRTARVLAPRMLSWLLRTLRLLAGGRRSRVAAARFGR